MGQKKKPRTILVLGGGGLKGLAHLGLYEVVKEQIQPDAIVGTSIGALAGAMLASGIGPEELRSVAEKLEKKDILRLNYRSMWIGGFKQVALFQDEPLLEYIESILPIKSFSELNIPLRVNAVSLDSGRERWFGSGRDETLSLAKAVYASCAIPLFYPPLAHQGTYWVDGAIKSRIGIQEARKWGGEVVIASDVGRDFEPLTEDGLQHGLISMHERVFKIVAEERWKDQRDEFEAMEEVIYIRPNVGKYDKFDFTRIQRFYLEGKRAGYRAYPLIERRIKQLQKPSLPSAKELMAKPPQKSKSILETIKRWGRKSREKVKASRITGGWSAIPFWRT